MAHNSAQLIHKIGLQGLSCLVALVSERSVTRAAESMQLSQPTMSNILARLRGLLEDPVLIRTAHGMEPTALALKLADAVRHNLLGLEAAFARQRVFDPATTAGQLTIATADSNGLALRPVMSRLRREAPGLKLALRRPQFGHIRQSLEEGECDIAIGYFPDAAKGLRQSALYSEPHRCISAESHPQFRDRLTLAQYAAASHVGYSSPVAQLPTGDESLNRALAALGVTRRIDVHVPSPFLYGYIVADTEMIATIGRRLAENFCRMLPVRIFDLPFKAPDLRISMVWHERTHQIGTHQWVRQVIREGTATMSLT